MKEKCRPVANLLFVSCLFTATSSLAQQNYPIKHIRHIISAESGSSIDTASRIFDVEFAKILGQQVIVDNRSGASGNIGAELAANTPADGYTWFTTNTNHTSNAAVFRTLRYDLIRDFDPVTKLVTAPWLLVVHSSLPAKSVSELIKLAKAKPGAINHASAGTGSGTFLAMALFKDMASINMFHVPYKGAGAATIGTVSGEVACYFGPLTTMLPHVRQGRLHGLGVSSANRVSWLPDIPAMSETVPGFEFTAWQGLLVPAGTPKEIIIKINKAVRTGLNNPAVSKSLIDLGFSIEPSTPEELGVYIKTDLQKMAKLIQKLGLAKSQ